MKTCLWKLFQYLCCWLWTDIFPHCCLIARLSPSAKRRFKNHSDKMRISWDLVNSKDIRITSIASFKCLNLELLTNLVRFSSVTIFELNPWNCSMTMKMIMNCFCGMVDQRTSLSLISSRNHFQRSSPLQISDTPRVRFEPVKNLSSDFVECSCGVVKTTITAL